MKYCLRYTNICTKLDQTDEITIKYIEDKGLIDFLEKYNSKRVNLLIDASVFPETEVRKLASIKNFYPQYNFAIAMSHYKPELTLAFVEADIPFYISTPCTNWEQFQLYIAAGVSDINVSGPLGFELPKVKRVLNKLEQKIQVRATPNKIKKLEEGTNDIVGFFIRPEDVKVYEEFIDILDFEGLEHQDAFYSIYAEQKLFMGNLNQYIYNFSDSVDNCGLISLFGERRKDCGRQCLSGGGCRRCYLLANLAPAMKERVRKKIMGTLKKE